MLPGALIVTDEPVRYTPSPEVEPQVEMAVDPRAARDSLGQQTLYANAPGKEVKSRFVCKSGGSSSPSARLLGRPPVSGGVRGRGNAGRPRRVWS